MAFELIKVSELPELTTPSDPNVIPIQDGDYLKRISFENLKEAVVGDVADDLTAEVTARESAVSGEATARGNADTAILADLASAYSASDTYAVGDYCTKDGQLYRCTTAIETAEAWTASHWTAVALSDDVSNLKNALKDQIIPDIKNAKFGVETFDLYAEFKRGGLLSGVYYSSYTWRVCTDSIMTFANALTITIASGFRIGIHYFVNGAFSADSGWKTGSYTVPANSSFKMVIGRVMEDQSESADVQEFVHAVTFETLDPKAIAYRVNALTVNSATNGILDVNSLNWQNKMFSTTDGNWYDMSNRLSATVVTSAPIDLDIHIESGYDMVVRLWSSGTIALSNLLDDSGWISGDDSYRVRASTKFSVMIRKHNDANITVSEGLAAIQFYQLPSKNLEEYATLLDGHFNSDMFQIGSLSQGKFIGASSYPYRIATPQMLVYPFDITLSVASGYRYAIHTYDSNYQFVADSGWQHGTKLVPKGQLFRITISENPQASTTPDIPTYVNSVSVYVGMLVGMMPQSYSYVAHGDTVLINKTKYNVSPTTIKASSPSSLSANSYQGFGVNNGVIFQFYSDDVLELINYNTGSVIADLSSPTGHGNAIGFLNAYTEETDEFPNAIVSDTLSDPKAYLVRISRSAVTLLNTITFPANQAGHYANVMIDADNDILYTVGYTQASWSDPANNRMVFAKWDWSQLTTNNDSTVTPLFVESFNTPFIQTMQGSTFYNGKMFVLSSAVTNTETKIYVVDPFEKRIRTIFSDMPSGISDIECEAVFFVPNEGVALIKPNASASPYYKIEFSS